MINKQKQDKKEMKNKPIVNQSSSDKYEETKEAYLTERIIQKKIVVDWLQNNGFTILTMKNTPASNVYSCGQGKKGYNANRSIEKYDLQNWLFICARKNDEDYLISFQCFDKDPVTNDHHTLIDRIGIYKHKTNDKRNEKIIAEECFTNMENTGIDLPMDDKKLKKLVRKLEEYENLCRRPIYKND